MRDENRSSQQGYSVVAGVSHEIRSLKRRF